MGMNRLCGAREASPLLRKPGRQPSGRTIRECICSRAYVVQSGYAPRTIAQEATSQASNALVPSAVSPVDRYRDCVSRAQLQGCWTDVWARP